LGAGNAVLNNEDLLDLYNERIAIVIHCGLLSEREAIRIAYFQVRDIVGAANVPEEIRRQFAAVMQGVST
jgi:hypothetical protein